MPEATGAGAGHLTRLRCDVVDDVVVVGRRYPPGNVVEPQRMARLPRDRMIGARRVSTDADGAEESTQKQTHEWFSPRTSTKA